MRSAAKAWAGAATAGLGSLYTALADGTVTAQEWVGVALAVVGTAAGVYQVRNRTGG